VFSPRRVNGLKKYLETFRCQIEVLETFEFNLPYMGFFSMNDGKPIDFINAQVMRCIVCYNEVVNLVVLAQHSRCKKCFITYFKANDIMAMKKHLYVKHSMLAHKLFEKGNNNTKDPCV
jgi:hypothetical protein